MPNKTQSIGVMLRYTDDGTMTYASLSSVDTVGWHPHELVGRNVFDMLADPDDQLEARKLLELERRGFFSHGVVNRWRHRDGGTVWMSWSPVEIEGEIYGHGVPVPEFMVPVSPLPDTGDTASSQRERQGERETGTGKMCDDCAEAQREITKLRTLVAAAGRLLQDGLSSADADSSSS